MTRLNYGRKRRLDFKEIEDLIPPAKPSRFRLYEMPHGHHPIRSRAATSTKSRKVKITLPSMPWEQNQ